MLASEEPSPLPPKAADQRLLGGRDFSPWGKPALLSGNHDLSIFEHGFPQLRNSCCTAFPGKVGSSGAALCSGLVRINCHVTEGLHSHFKFGESTELGAGVRRYKRVSVGCGEPADSGAGGWVCSPWEGGTR